MAKKALIVYGGFQGHAPEACAKLFAGELEKLGYEVVLSETLDSYADKTLMESIDLIVPVWTMGELEKEQMQGVNDAVQAGAGLAGFHGGIIDAFRKNTQWQWMTGGQFVAHPGNMYPSFEVSITDNDHPATKGIGNFTMTNTERYYNHVDPANHVLATVTFEDMDNVVMPFAWTRQWGKGRVFVAAWGHNDKDFDVPEAKQMVLQGMQWATR